MKEDLLKWTKDFYEQYARLPYLSEDDFTFFDKEEDRDRIFRASVQINKHFKDYAEYVDWLFNIGYMTVEKLANILNSTEVRVRNVMEQKVKKPDLQLRKGLHKIIGIDYYKEILTPYNDHCLECKNKCRQHYYVDVVCRKKKKK